MKLDEAIVVHFDETARAALAAGLGYEWAELPGDAPAARAAALVEAAARAGQAPALLAALAAARPAVPWAELPYPAAALARLHAALCRRHSLDSLRTLCFRLGLDYDDLPGESKAGRARELILALERQGRVAELWARYEIRDTKYELRARHAPGRVRRPFRRWRAARGLAASSLAPLHSYLVSRISYLKTRLATSGPLLMRLSPGVSLLSFVALWLLIARGMTNDDLRLAGEAWGMTAGPPSALVARHTPRATPSPTAAPAATRQWAFSLSPLLPYPLSASLPRPNPSYTPPTPTPMEKEHVAPRPATPAVLIVGDRGANVRRGPGPQYAVVVTLRAGARLELRAVSPTGEWYQVRLPGHGTPWIDAGYATVIGGVGGVPVEEVTSYEQRATSEETDAPVAWAGIPSATPPRPAALPSTPPPPASPTPRPTVMPTQTPPRPTAAPTVPPPYS